MDLMASLLYNHKEFPDLATFHHNLYPLITLMKEFNDTFFEVGDSRAFYRNLTVAAYEASLHTIRGEGATVQYNFAADGAPAYSSDNVYDFCGFDCSIFAMRFTDIGNVLVSEYSFNLFTGSCAEVLDLSKWGSIVSTPPAALVESYFKCTQEPLLAFYNALGISMGIVSLILTVLAFTMLPMVLCKMRKVSSVVSIIFGLSFITAYSVF
jgi:hypothetical protein